LRADGLAEFAVGILVIGLEVFLEFFYFADCIIFRSEMEFFSEERQSRGYFAFGVDI